MTINTLSDLLKAAERKHPNPVESPLQARTWVYQAAAEYMVKAETFSRAKTIYVDPVCEAMGALIHAVAIDARVNLAPEKFALLEGYPFAEAHPDLTLNKQDLREALASTWGGQDVFIERLSGGLFGSYLKAMSALKPQVRALGHDLSYSATIYLKGL